ncbi:MAG TPA: hypothetical protein VHN74_05690 [Candidatus Angelobacter sp.]|jgi:hypothetical protein|nr:hypothetical protein [Candidatus Angelobacter sp.]
MEEEKRIMFEIYREPEDNGSYRVVYFTELGEHEREIEIGNALRGNHVFDGYILSRDRWEAKQAIGRILDELNRGARMGANEIELELKGFVIS